jgi:hypothetical protein
MRQLLLSIFKAITISTRSDIMLTRIVGILFLVIALGIGVIGFIKSKSTMDTAHASDKSEISGAQNKAAQDRPGVINGAVNPEMIPDHVAYAMLFRMIANRPEESAKRSIRAYVKQIFGCDECSKESGLGGRIRVRPDNPDIDAFITVAEEHHRRVSVLDAQAENIKGRSWPDPNPEVMARLTELQGQNEALSAEMAASLPNRLSSIGMDKLRQYIVERVKPGIKIIPGPQPPPDSNFYQPPPPAGSAPPTIHHRH